MGYERLKFSVECLLSRHNSEKDKEHDALWAELRLKVEDIVNEPKYEEIQALMW